MATRRYGISKGENIDQIIEAVGAATAADSIELTVDLAVLTTHEGKMQVLNALDLLKSYITKGNWPPA